MLLLGGTTEAGAIARELATDRHFAITMSLAGRTANPAASPVNVRVGGFGGAKGLRAYLDAERIDAVIDATHPFAAQISANAILACRDARVPLLAVERPSWEAVAGDRWTHFSSVEAAIAAIGDRPRNVFSGLGRLSLAALAEAPQHRFVARVIDAGAGDNPEHTGVAIVTGRGPFAVNDEIALFRQHGIELVLSKNSGGEGAYAKIAAARRLGLEIFMVDRPALPRRLAVETPREAVQWLRAHVESRMKRGV